ncbi:MAG: hypothetical protein IJ094_00030 [Bacilli bacterium]|nr:hypothetical protein [Bacilli bacterium]
MENKIERQKKQIKKLKEINKGLESEILTLEITLDLDRIEHDKLKNEYDKLKNEYDKLKNKNSKKNNKLITIMQDTDLLN